MSTVFETSIVKGGDGSGSAMVVVLIPSGVSEHMMKSMRKGWNMGDEVDFEVANARCLWRGEGGSDVVSWAIRSEHILGPHKAKGRYEIGLLVISNWSEYQSFIFPSWLVFI